jgi:hypothetical protein
LARRFRVGLIGRIQVIEDERVRIVRRGGLFEATIWLAQKAIESFHQVGHRGWIHFEANFQRPWNQVFRQSDAARCSRFEHVAERADDRETLWHDLEHTADGVRLSGFAIADDGQRRLSIQPRGLQSEQLAALFVRTKLDHVLDLPVWRSRCCTDKRQVARLQGEAHGAMVVAIVDDADRHFHHVVAVDFQRQLRIDRERLARFNRLRDSADTAINGMPGDEHLIPSDVVR